MTETEWLDCTDPTPMLEYLLGKVSDRKLRLYGCACVRRIWHLLLYEGREALEVSEQYGDDKVLDQVLREARLALEQETPNRAETPEEMAAWATILAADDAVSWAESIGIDYVSDPGELSALALRADIRRSDAMASKEAWEKERSSHCTLIRDMVGNPFRPLNTTHSWSTPNVMSLAQGIYDERAFDRLPILADALEDAGCDNTDILNHCRQPGEHVRGCWVVDLLLGKS